MSSYNYGKPISFGASNVATFEDIAAKDPGNVALKKMIGSNNWTVDHNTAYYGPTGDCGYPTDRTDVSDQYIIEINSDAMKRTVRSLLQEDFTTSVTSTWADPAMAGLLSKLTQDSVQMVTGYGVGSQFMTRRIWHGSSPMKLQIKLKFEAITDAWKEVVLPCATLQQMALPAKFRYAATGQDRGLAHEFFEHVLIVPPGPNPFYISEQARAKISEASELLGKAANWSSRRAGDIITIKIGGLMSFKSVIVRSVEVLWKKRFNKKGNPTGAVATVNFESFEIYTKDDIASEILYKETKLEKMQKTDEFKKIYEDFMSPEEWATEAPPSTVAT